MAAGSLRAFSICDASILSSFLPASLSCLFTPWSDPSIAFLATSVSDVQATPRALRSPSNSLLFLLKLWRASPMLVADDAALSRAVRTSSDLPSLSFLSSSAMPAFSSRVMFVFFLALRSESLSARVLLELDIASNCDMSCPASTPRADSRDMFMFLFVASSSSSRFFLISSAVSPAMPNWLAMLLNPPAMPFRLSLLFVMLPLSSSVVRPALEADMASRLNILESAASSLFVLERASIIPPLSSPTFFRFACSSTMFL